MALLSLAAKFGIKIRPQYSRAQPCASKNSRFWTDPEGTREPPPPKKKRKEVKSYFSKWLQKGGFLPIPYVYIIF